MEFTSSYRYKPYLTTTCRLNEIDLANVLRSRASREQASVLYLEEQLPALQAKAEDRYGSITFKGAAEGQIGWILASYRDTAPDAGPRDFMTVAMCGEGTLWTGKMDYSTRVLEVADDYKAYNVPGMARHYREEADQVAVPLVSEQDNEFVAATLQNLGHGLETALDFLLNPRLYR